MTCGIYKITNLINNKCYIGCSINVEQRWVSHKSEVRIKGNASYDYIIHKAMRKYGIENFELEIIEEVCQDNLFDREIYWIDFYKSFGEGYNGTPGGDCGPVKFGESNGNAKLTKSDVVYIRTAILEGKMRSEVFPLFSNKISTRGFTHVWLGTSWKDVIPEAIEYVQSKEYISKVRSFAASSRITDDRRAMWADIKNKKERGLNRLDVYKEYADKYSIGGFNKVWYK